MTIGKALNFNMIDKFLEIFKQKDSRAYTGLVVSQSVTYMSSGLLGIFLPIFFYTVLDENIYSVLLFYGTGHLLYALLIPIGARLLNAFGFRKSLFISYFFGAGFYVSLYFVDHLTAVYLLPISFILLLITRLTYWIPMHIDFAKFTEKGDRGKQVGFLFAVFTLFAVLGPMIAGVAIESFGFVYLFTAAIILHLIASIPILLVPRTRENFDWRYRQVFAEVFAKENRNVVLAFVASGVEEGIRIVVWPIFIFMLLVGDYFDVGTISGLIVGVTAIFQLFVGDRLDHDGQKKKTLKIASLLSALGWIVRIFVSTGFQIFIAGAYHDFVRTATRTSFTTLFYETLAERKHYVDEFTVLHEVANHLSKTMTMVFVAFIAFYIGLKWSFLLAAVASIFLNYLTLRSDVKDKIVL